ncbi:hypothetical protein HMN09_00810400 [Mycena chlorophos]|uniref:DUF6593 domain-containing protein n=1 Tax=Mycena chlorophos TaxID=658473 RepID=A0A8H6SVF9_MYCCL|nr:hypothetical protein HMN09_00810400 [Mycena chlorophos]
MAAPIPFSFLGAHINDSAVVGPDQAVHYEISTTRGFMKRKVTTIKSADGVTGSINWREETFTLNGVEKQWDDLQHRETTGIFHIPKMERTWNWSERPYNLKYVDRHKELLATPTFPGGEVVRYNPRRHRPFHAESDTPAVIYFPQNMDPTERMFLLMVVLRMEFLREAAEAAAAAGGG